MADVVAQLEEQLLATNRALGGALLVLRAVRDGEPAGSRKARVAQECVVAQERYFETRQLLEERGVMDRSLVGGAIEGGPL